MSSSYPRRHQTRQLSSRSYTDTTTLLSAPLRSANVGTCSLIGLELSNAGTTTKLTSTSSQNVVSSPPQHRQNQIDIAVYLRITSTSPFVSTTPAILYTSTDHSIHAQSRHLTTTALRRRSQHRGCSPKALTSLVVSSPIRSHPRRPQQRPTT